MTYNVPTLGMAWKTFQAGDPRQAESLCRQILQVDPRNTDVLWVLGMILQAVDRLDEAVAVYQNTLELKPDQAEVHNNLGNTLRQMGRLDEAEARLRHALTLKPDYANAFNNLGIVLSERGLADEAISSFRQALTLKPDHTEALNGLGSVLSGLDHLDEAMACFRQALQIQPNHAEAHKNLGITLLLAGRYAEGWPEYEWRWKTPECPPRPFPQPRWDGSPLNGRTILIHTDQGLGDAFQFIRFVPLVKQRGGTTIVECQQRLSRALSTCPGIDQIVERGQPIPRFDCHIPLLSLPGVLGTTVETIPAQVPYLHAEEPLVNHWRDELATRSGFKIGINWGAAVKNWAGLRQRNIPLRHFAPLGRIEGVTLVSLQKGKGTEELAELPPDVPVLDLGPRLDEQTGAFVDTAAVLKNLDLVITSDTSIGHLAGALGVPVWIILPYAPHWVWMLGRDDSPWYPSARLFRQPRPGHWEGAIAEVEQALRRHLARQRRSITVEIAPGELIDRITILRIKERRITDEAKLRNVRAELNALTAIRDRALIGAPSIDDLATELESINEALWDVEDALRVHERNGDFGPEFVERARSVYHQNDRRFALKRQINERLGAGIVEEKQLPAYA